MNSPHPCHHLDLLLAELGIGPDVLRALGLPPQPEAGQLVLAETGSDGRDHLLVPSAAKAWFALRQAALEAGIRLEIVSAFRGLEEQAQIIRDKLRARLPLETILSLSAPPGYSEHHSGRALDLNTPGCAEREEGFEATAAFAWLAEHAGRFGFVLSYPRGNELGFIYEPWHWYYTG